MWTENKIFLDDLKYVNEAKFIDWDRFKNKTILITGATGLIGFNLLSSLVYANSTRQLNMQILALVRNIEKAEKRFHDLLQAGEKIKFIEGDLLDIPKISGPVDFIIHGGSPTASRFFSEHPVETIDTNLIGSKSLLELAKKKKAESFLFLSSMEVYGGLHKREKVDENHESFVNTMSPRNCYPEAKRMVEAMCASYATEYDVPAKVIRLTQTFGAGIRKDDNRVFAQFARAAMEQKDIILLTLGGTEHCYLYTADAVAAILTVLLEGKDGEAYNAANEKSYCSIKEMAQTVANLPIIKEKFGGSVDVKVQVSEDSLKMYPPELYMNLDTRKLQKLGWQARTGLIEMFTRMIKTM